MQSEMSAIDLICQKLLRYPQIVYRVEGSTLTIDAATPSGFTITFTEAPSNYTVSFEGWHEHFDSEDEALNCLGFGLSDRCRLRVERRGTFPYRWAVESRTGAGWQEDSTTGLLFMPFWRSKDVVYLQNTIIHAAEPGVSAEAMPGL